LEFRLTDAGLATALADRYRLERELGAGGMATVYLAEDLKHGRKVAIKVLRPELAAVIGAERFLSEIKTTANLQHPHILALFDSGVAELGRETRVAGLEAPASRAPSPVSFLYYVMPYVEGETLRTRLDRERQLGIEEAVRLTREVADALEYAHRHGIIHRDIKPENILLHEGRPMVADFGIALAVSTAAGGRMTETGLSLGTPHYMSPEQATAEKEITARSDIYSLGSVLYEMLSGNPPHTGASAQQIIMKIVTEDPRPVMTLRKSVPPHVAAAVAKSLEKLPADRFDSASAFGYALANPAFRVSSPIARSGATPAGVRRKVNPLIAGLTVAALALALTAWAWLRPAPDRSMTDSWQVELTTPDTARIVGPPSMSADGRMVVYPASDGALWLLRSDGAPPQPIPGTRGAIVASLSPDGTRIAFLRDGALELMPVAGGTGTRVTDTTDLVVPPAWMGNERLVLAQVAGLVQFSAEGGKRVQLTTVGSDTAQFWHVFPVALPNNRGLLFVEGRADFQKTAEWRIAVVGPDGGAPKVIMPGVRVAYAEPGHLIVTRANGTIVAVPFDLRSLRVTGPERLLVAGLQTVAISNNGSISASRTGRLLYLTGEDWSATDLVRVRRDGSVVAVDTTRSGNFSAVVASPDARWAALTVTGAGPDELRLRNLGTGATVRLAEPGLFLRSPVFTSNGDTVIFAGLSLRKMGIFRASVGGTAALEPVLTIHSGGFAVPMAVSPAGLLYYMASRGTSSSLLVHDLRAPDSPDRVVLPEEADVVGASVSPDGRWLAYGSRASGHPELLVRSTDLSRAERWQIPRPGVAGAGPLLAASWSRDGRELLYRAGDVLVSARVVAGASFGIADQRVLLNVKDYAPSFDLLPNGDFLMIRNRATSSGASRLMMMDRWNSGMR
jgi:serine/threonine-protein kinase